MDYKHKLTQDINKSMVNNDFVDIRKVSTGTWKQYLSEKEINLIDGFEDKVLKDTIKNRIYLEKKPLYYFISTEKKKQNLFFLTYLCMFIDRVCEFFYYYKTII